MPMSRSSAAAGSSSTTSARFCISRRNRAGIRRTASATSRSNASRVILRLLCGANLVRFAWRGCRLGIATASLAGALAKAGQAWPHSSAVYQSVVIAIAADRTLIAQGLGAADATTVQDLDVGGERPLFLR